VLQSAAKAGSERLAQNPKAGKTGRAIKGVSKK